MHNANIPLSLMAGLFSFLSPCILPLIPGYISFVTGSSIEELEASSPGSSLMPRVLARSLLFVAGFSVVFILMGGAASYLGSFLVRYKVLLDRIAGIVIILLGLHLTGLLRIRWLNYEKKFHLERSSVGGGSAFALGLAFAFGWTPCVGPILAGILTLAATEGQMYRGMLLLAAYSIGIAVPFLMTAVAIGAFIRAFSRYRALIRWVQLLAGCMLIAVGVMILTARTGRVMALVPEFFYDFAR